MLEKVEVRIRKCYCTSEKFVRLTSHCNERLAAHGFCQKEGEVPT